MAALMECVGIIGDGITEKYRSRTKFKKIKQEINIEAKSNIETFENFLTYMRQNQFSIIEPTELKIYLTIEMKNSKIIKIKEKFKLFESDYNKIKITERFICLISKRLFE